MPLVTLLWSRLCQKHELLVKVLLNIFLPIFQTKVKHISLKISINIQSVVGIRVRALSLRETLQR